MNIFNFVACHNIVPQDIHNLLSFLLYILSHIISGFFWQILYAAYNSFGPGFNCKGNDHDDNYHNKSTYQHIPHPQEYEFQGNYICIQQITHFIVCANNYLWRRLRSLNIVRIFICCPLYSSSNQKMKSAEKCKCNCAFYSENVSSPIYLYP